MDIGSSNPNPRTGTGERGLGDMELDAVRALADFKHIERLETDVDMSRSELADLVDDGPQDNKATEATTEERINIEQDSKLSTSSIRCSGSHVSCFGRRMKRNMTKAERDAKRNRRVLANRESARQAIQRRQAFREESIKRAADLLRENKDMRMEKELLMKKYLSLKDRNKELKKQMVKEMVSEVKVGAEITMRHLPPSTSPSTELSLAAPWPSSSSASAASYEDVGSCKAWVYPLFPQTSGFFPSSSDELGGKGVDINVNPHESGHCTEVGNNVDRESLHVGSKTNVLPEMNTGIDLEETPTGFARHNKISEHDPGGDEREISSRPYMKTDSAGSIVAEKSWVVSDLPVMKLVDPATAAAARKRRKDLRSLNISTGSR